MRVPDGWKLVHLKDVASKIQDGNYGADYPKSDEFLVGGIPFLTSKVIGGNGTINRNKMDFISPEKHLVLKKAQITKRDILFTNRGANVGTIAIVDDDILDANIGPQLTLIRTNPIKANYKFLFQSLRGPFFQKQVGQQDSGSAMNFFGIKETEKFKLMLPPIAEQQKIAQILSTWDKAIEKLEALIAAKQKRKKALMQQLLTGKKRFAGFEGEWKSVRLSKLLKEEKAKNKDCLISRVLSVTNHSGFVLPEEQFSRQVASSDLSNYKIVRKGQFGYNPSRINVGSFARLDTYSDGVLSPLYVVFSIDEKELDTNFFLNWMSSHEAKQRIISSTQGSVRDSVGFDALSSFHIKLPDIEEQQKIASVLTAADNEIKTHQNQLSAMKEQKKGLMQQLLTGKKRVKIDAPELLAAAGA